MTNKIEMITNHHRRLAKSSLMFISFCLLSTHCGGVLVDKSCAAGFAGGVVYFQYFRQF